MHNKHTHVALYTYTMTGCVSIQTVLEFGNDGHFKKSVRRGTGSVMGVNKTQSYGEPGTHRCYFVIMVISLSLCVNVFQTTKSKKIIKKIKKGKKCNCWHIAEV